MDYNLGALDGRLLGHRQTLPVPRRTNIQIEDQSHGAPGLEDAEKSAENQKDAQLMTHLLGSVQSNSGLRRSTHTRRQWVTTSKIDSNNAALSRRYTNLNKLSEALKENGSKIPPLQAFMSSTGPRLGRARLLSLPAKSHIHSKSPFGLPITPPSGAEQLKVEEPAAVPLDNEEKSVVKALAKLSTQTLPSPGNILSATSSEE